MIFQFTLHQVRICLLVLYLYMMIDSSEFVSCQYEFLYSVHRFSVLNLFLWFLFLDFMTDFAGYLICISILFKLIILFFILVNALQISSCVRYNPLHILPGRLWVGWSNWELDGGLLFGCLPTCFVGRQKFLLPYFMGSPFWLLYFIIVCSFSRESVHNMWNLWQMFYYSSDPIYVHI